MKIAAVVLFVLQALALFVGFVNDSLPAMGPVEAIGYFSPTIIGIILLIVAKIREK